MCKGTGTYRITAGTIFIVVLLFSCEVASSQKRTVKTRIKIVPQEILTNFRNRIPPFYRDTLAGALSSLKPPVRPKDKSDLFYDSLKVKVSKNRLTREIFKMVVVSNHDTIYNKKFSSTSDVLYSRYEGKRIRNIEIRRLNVFGTDINFPLSEDSKNYENLLNKTHFNTTVKIIRKNLLFTEGDRISPLLLSDNERLLRQLPYINDARITIVGVNDEEADIVVFTKDIYSLGASYDYRGLKKGSVSVFDKNIFGIGHEFGLDMPFDSHAPNSPGFGFHYYADNIKRTFINLKTQYLTGLGDRTYGFDLSRRFVSSTTKYAGGISVKQMYTNTRLDTLITPLPLKYNLQDYWISRSFLLNIRSVTRLIIGARYLNNNVFEHPIIFPDSYHNLQKYKIYMASAALSVQKYTKTNLIYSYGRTEDIPYGGLVKFTAGRENNEFKMRTYLSTELAYGNKNLEFGYFYLYSGYSVFLNQKKSEQGLLSLRMNYFSNLVNVGNSRIRNFVQINYTRGIGRYTEEFLRVREENGFSGFKSDSVRGNQRLNMSLESVLFSTLNVYGFKFAFFGFTDIAFLSGTHELLSSGSGLVSIGIGFRIRNDNLIFNTFQIRLAYIPNPPAYSQISTIILSGEQLLQPPNFDPGPPAINPYR